MRFIFSLFAITLFSISIFGQVDVLELVPEIQRLDKNVKRIQEFYQLDYGDTIIRKPVLNNEFCFDREGKLIKEIEFEKFTNKVDTVRCIFYEYKDSLLSRRLIYTYHKYDTDSLDIYETFYKYEYDNNQYLVCYMLGNLYKEYYYYNKLGKIESLYNVSFPNKKNSIYNYRKDGVLKTIVTWDRNNKDKLESITYYDHSGREVKYKRYTSGNSHTTKYRRSKYNSNGKLKMSSIETVENLKFNTYYTYSNQGILSSIIEKKIYPRCVSPDFEIIMESDSVISKKKIEREQKSNKEIEKRAVVKKQFTYKYNSLNLLSEIEEYEGSLKLRTVIRTYIYEYY